jgi:hypothetical protein
VELASRLRERTPEIEESILACIRAISVPVPQEESGYALGQRLTVAAAVEYALAGIEQADGLQLPIPAAAAAQACRAAQGGVGLDTVLRRYMAGDRRLGEFILEEAEELPGEAVRQIMRARGRHVDTLVALVSAEYAEEVDRLARSPGQRLALWVQELLAGEEPAADEDPGYRFGGWHLGMVASGAIAGNGHELSELAARLESQALIVPRPDRTAWVWLGRQRPVACAEVERQLSSGSYPRLRLAVGESRLGLAGWRLTHREAKVAQQVMARQPRPLMRCGHVALFAALLRDEVSSGSLLDTYLLPLEGRGDAGKVMRETLRAYFAAGGNTVATAAALRVNRHTIHRRLRNVEQRLGQLVDGCRAELETALKLEEMLDSPPGG